MFSLNVTHRRGLFFSIVFVAILLSSSFSLASSLRLEWADNSDNEEGFHIERLNSDNFIAIASVGADVQTYIDSGLTPGMTYCYRVIAFNSAGSSNPSNQACATAPQSGSGEIPSPGGDRGGSEGGGGAPTSIAHWIDYRVSLDMKSDHNGAIGVMFRYVDMNNYYRFSWSKQGKYRRLEKIQNGKLTILAKDSARYVTGQNYQIVIVAEGSALSVSIDGKLIFLAHDHSFAVGPIGLYSHYNRGSIFDNILVEDFQTGSTLLSDDFNDNYANGWTMIDDQGTKYGPSVWTVEGGALVQSSNIGSGTAERKGTFALYTSRNWIDYRASLKIRSTDRDCLGVMFRFQDNNNYYRLSWCGGGSFSRHLVKMHNGQVQMLAEDEVVYTIGQTYQLEVTTRGAQMEIRVDGIPVFSVIDATHTQGSIALYSWWNAGSLFDDVLVEDLNSGTILLWDDFSDDSNLGWTIFDEGTIDGPSSWSINHGALVQNSNIGSNTLERRGTFVLY